MADSQTNKKNDGLPAFGNVPASLFLTIILIVSFTAYFNSLFNDFVYDDYAQIVENYALRDLGNLPRVFIEDVWSFMGGGQSNYYRPLMHVVYMLNYAVFGLDPWGFHLVNILFHTGVCVLVYFVACRMFSMTNHSPPRLLSFIAALLFATHPIHTEAVTWVACFPELSFTLLYLWSLYVYMGAVQDEYIVSQKYFILSVLLFMLATLCKETALTLPLMLVVYDYSFVKNSYRPLRYLKRYLPYLGVAVFYLAMRTAVLSGFAPLKRHSALSGYEYFINVFPLFARYLEKLILPLNLKVYYVFHPISSLLTSVGIISLVVTCVFVCAALAAGKKNKLIFFNLMIIAVPLLPALYIPALGDNTFTERYLYLSSFGFVSLIALLAGRLCEWKPQIANGVLASVLAIACLYSIGTVQRNMVWKNDMSLWLDAVKKEPEGATPRSQLGVVYFELGEYAQALEQFRIAAELNPDYADAYTNIGLVNIAMGKVQQALENYQKALQLKPSSPETYNNIGVAYVKLGRLDNAVDSFQKSLQLNSQQPGVHNNLGDTYEKMGQLDGAVEEYRKALRIQPNNAESYNHLGIAYAKKGMVDEAIRHFQIALRIKPYDPGFHMNIANAYRMKGMVDKAEEHKRQAVYLQGRN